MFKKSIIALVFILGLYFTIVTPTKEGFEGNIKLRCPNILIQKGTDFYLYNSNLANVPGVNPLRFNSLEDYTEFVDWQRSQGIRCPVMFVQETYDAQGKAVYKARPSPINLQGGLQDYRVGEIPQVTKLLDASRDDSPYNKNSYPGFDSHDQYIGLNTPLDQMFHDNGSNVSPNQMDANWGGQAYTEKLVDDGYYKDDEVYFYT